MPKMTVSFKTNTSMTNLKHNNRELTKKELQSPAHNHIISDLSDQNILIFKRDIHDVYEEEFGESLEKYNAKQRRKDRKIDNYYKHVQRSKTLDLQREFIVSVGNKDDWDRRSFDEKRMVGEALARYVEDFNSRHDHLVVYNAVVHLDEAGAPHAHFNVVPIADGYKNGLAKQPSFSKALQQEGFREKGKFQLKEFAEHERSKIEEFVHGLGIERKAGQTNNIKDMREYKQVMQEIDEQKRAQESTIAQNQENIRRLNEIEGRQHAKLDEMTEKVSQLEEKERLIKLEAENVSIKDKFKRFLVQNTAERAQKLADELVDERLRKRTADLEKRTREAERRVFEANEKTKRAQNKLIKSKQELKSQIEGLEYENQQLKQKNSRLNWALERLQRGLGVIMSYAKRKLGRTNSGRKISFWDKFISKIDHELGQDFREQFLKIIHDPNLHGKPNKQKDKRTEQNFMDFER